MNKYIYMYGGSRTNVPVTSVVTSERQIEQRLAIKAKAHNGLALKWTSPSFAGVPDRIVFLPGGRIVFVELKAPGKKPPALQQRVCNLLRQLGADVRVIDSYGGVDALFA